MSLCIEKLVAETKNELEGKTLRFTGYMEEAAEL